MAIPVNCILTQLLKKYHAKKNKKKKYHAYNTNIDNKIFLLTKLNHVQNPSILSSVNTGHTFYDNIPK